jgi:phage-related protein
MENIYDLQDAMEYEQMEANEAEYFDRLEEVGKEFKEQLLRNKNLRNKTE